MAFTAPVFASNYGFSTGADTLAGFGKSTSNDNPVSPDPMSQNERRNKDAAVLPPPYFYGSGDIPTDSSSLYHDNLQDSGLSGIGGNISGNYGGIAGNASAQPSSPGFQSSTSVVTVNTEPRYYADGSIGTLYVERTNRTIKVYEGESLENMKKGAGRFAMTSAWDGNIGLCGHNRGSWPYFSFVKDLRIGDRITYTTPYGSRVYEVFFKEQIGEYDYSLLGWSAENLLTLITCVENSPDIRWAAQLREVR
jgi:sortase A